MSAVSCKWEWDLYLWQHITVVNNLILEMDEKLQQQQNQMEWLDSGNLVWKTGEEAPCKWDSVYNIFMAIMNTIHIRYAFTAETNLNPIM